MSSSAHSSSPPSPTHAFLTQQNFTNPSPCSQFFCVYEVAQSLHKNNMSGANTKSILARFRDNNWKKGRDFVKTFYVKKLMWEREGSWARAGWRDWDLGNGTIMLRKANWDKTLQKLLKFSDCHKSIWKQIRPSCRKTFRPHFVFVWFHESNEI